MWKYDERLRRKYDKDMREKNLRVGSKIRKVKLRPYGSRGPWRLDEGV